VRPREGTNQCENTDYKATRKLLQIKSMTLKSNDDDDDDDDVLWYQGVQTKKL